MSNEDKARNAAESVKGKAKEAAGTVTGDRELKDEGRAEESRSDVKQAGEKLKDAAKR
jgi:uncharacterized protein YjbJ (UPF0337 family)